VFHGSQKVLLITGGLDMQCHFECACVFEAMVQPSIALLQHGPTAAGTN
jgi:hypothetical protein